MPGRAPETYIKANLSRQEAERLYEPGREAAIWALPAFAAQLKGAQEKDPASDINTPSGQTPVYTDKVHTRRLPVTGSRQRG